ncbi:MAG: hypothetical protein V8T46_06510 [Sutterella seckii]
MLFENNSNAPVEAGDFSESPAGAPPLPPKFIIMQSETPTPGS